MGNLLLQSYEIQSVEWQRRDRAYRITGNEFLHFLHLGQGDQWFALDDFLNHTVDIGTGDKECITR